MIIMLPNVTNILLYIKHVFRILVFVCLVHIPAKELKMLQSRFLSGGLGPIPDVDLVQDAQHLACRSGKTNCLNIKSPDYGNVNQQQWGSSKDTASTVPPFLFGKMMATAGRDGPGWSRYLVGNDGISFLKYVERVQFLRKINVPS